MAGPELLLDSNIRLWVVLPIVFITFFVGIIRHYVTQLLHSDKKVELEQVSDRSDGLLLVALHSDCSHWYVNMICLWLADHIDIYLIVLVILMLLFVVNFQSGPPAQPHP